MNLREWHASLGEREQRSVAWGGLVAAVLLVAGLVWKLGDAVTAAEERVAQRREDLAFIEAATPRLQAVPAARPGESLAIAVDRLAREGGLSQSLAGVEPAATGAIRARFTAASFDALAVMLARLQQERGVVAETASVSATGEPGLVDATLVLRGP
ncbi:MAG TPA: type II secretion system protein GspM [Steroidobacteraceae bacterium]|nr:type II secretion system protein GspM [Steroidobacteraceae bacterium]